MNNQDSLKEKAVDIKGKKYVLVSDRIIYFNENYPKGFIETELVSPLDSQIVVFKAIIWPDGSDLQHNRRFTGWSQAKWGEGYINKTSALENAETSAVGRALAMMGIGVIDSIASVDEINKAKSYEKYYSYPIEPAITYPPKTTVEGNLTKQEPKKATFEQQNEILQIAKEKSIELTFDVKDLSEAEALKWLIKAKEMFKK